MFDDYYIYVLRTHDGEILNEKRYILPPTRVSDILFRGTVEGWIDCNLSQYQSAMMCADGYVSTQVIFTGTQNPFNYGP